MEPPTVSNLANLQALCNIIANASEILGVAAGAPSLVFCWIPKAMGTVGYTSKLLIAGLVLLIGCLATPGLVNWAVAAGGIGLGVGVSAICGLLVIPLAVAMYFAPSIIAFRERRAKQNWIFALNFCFFIPFCFLISLIWASKGTPLKVEDGLNVNEYR